MIKLIIGHWMKCNRGCKQILITKYFNYLFRPQSELRPTCQRSIQEYPHQRNGGTVSAFLHLSGTSSGKDKRLNQGIISQLPPHTSFASLVSEYLSKLCLKTRNFLPLMLIHTRSGSQIKPFETLLNVSTNISPESLCQCYILEFALQFWF